LADAPGATPGQTGRVRRPAAGGQPEGCAERVRDEAATAAAKDKVIGFMGWISPGLWPQR